MDRADYTTTFPRALLALLGGVLIGTLVFLMEIAILLALRPNKLGEMADYLGATPLFIAMLIALGGLLFFGGGLLFIGTPIWAVLHFLHRRDWYYAVGLGALLGAAGFVVMAMWDPEWPAISLISFLTEEFGGLTGSNGRLNAEGWEAVVRGTIGIAIAGALAGLGLWKIAYRRPRLEAS
jgi:hypothetical protein